MATKKYTVKASADNAVKASFADDLKNAKETYNADFKQGPYAAAKNDGSIGERLDDSSTEGMGMVYLKDKNGNISAVGSEETYDFAKKMVDKFNKQWHDDMADAVWELQHGADDVDGACGKKKSVKSSAKRKPMMNSVKSSKKAVKASSVDSDRPNSAPNSWKSSERMAYKVTEDQTKGERSFPTSIDDVYKVLGEMQGTWTNPTTGWTGECEIYERDLDDGSYIFSLIFGGNELEPDDILYDPNGFNYYSNKPKFTIYPHSGAPIFADSIEDFKRKLKKEYSYLKKVGDNVGASMKKQPAKKSVKAARENKYVNEYVLQGNYGQGWEDLVSYDSRQEGNVDLKAYNENEQGVPHRLITRKGNNPNYKVPEDRFRVLQYDGGFKYKVGKTMKFSDLEEAVNYAEGNEKDCVLKDMVTGYSVQIPNDKRYSNYNADRKLKNIEKFYDVVSKSTDSVESSCFKKSVKASSMRKPMRKTIKASSMAKRRASKRVMAAYNGEDLVMYFDGKKVYQGQPGADMYDAVLKLCENDTNRLKFQEWCNQFGEPLFEEGEYGDAGETAYVFCELIYQEFNDGSDGEDGNGILNFEIFPASQEVSGATSVKCAEEAEDKVFTVSLYYDDKFRDLAGSEEFTDLSDAESYAHEYLDEFCVAIEYPDVDTLYINPDIYWDSFDGEFACTPEIAEWQNAVWRSMGIDASTKAVKAGINAPSTEGPLCVCENCKAEIESREGRQTVYNIISDLDIEPDEKLVCDWCEDEATELYQISPDDVSAAEDVEDMDYISGEDDEVDFGYGFTPNGEAIDESMVDELCRIANEILEKSELAKVSSWCDIDRGSFDYWCDGSAYVSEKFTITFTYTAELMTFNKFVKEDAFWTPSAEHGLGFEINVKDGEIESVTYTDKYWVGNSTPLDNAADIFDIEALEAYIGELAAPVAMDIYNGTTNI